MRKDIKDLKKFKGNTHGAPYGLFPIDRKKAVKDIPKLEQHEVNVVAKFFRKAGTAFRVVLCRVDELPEFSGDNQGNFIIDKIRNAKDMVQEGESTKTGGERLVSDLIKVYKEKRVVSFKDAWTPSQQLLRWENELGHILLDELDAAQITAAKNILLEGRSPKTVNNYLSSLSSCFDYAIKHLHWINANPVKNVAKEKVNNEIVRYLSNDERKRFFDGLEISKSPTLKVLCHFGINSGCR
jgi:hypothetical protein